MLCNQPPMAGVAKDIRLAKPGITTENKGRITLRELHELRVRNWFSLQWAPYLIYLLLLLAADTEHWL